MRAIQRAQINRFTNASSRSIKTYFIAPRKHFYPSHQTLILRKINNKALDNKMLCHGLQTRDAELYNMTPKSSSA